MRTLSLVLALVTIPLAATAGDIDGVWRTGSNDQGAYLQVTMAPCAANAALTCGTITRAFTVQGEDETYADLGKAIIMDMQSDGAGNFSDGKIWDPENGKTYSSKMTLQGDILDVEGCVGILCRGQHWTRVN
ncbi:MAG: DUF2147 domain-containing protein [Pseudomonadota bacterium]